MVPLVNNKCIIWELVQSYIIRYKNLADLMLLVVLANKAKIKSCCLCSMDVRNLDRR